jgi:hypothetical protein
MGADEFVYTEEFVQRQGIWFLKQPASFKIHVIGHMVWSFSPVDVIVLDV